MLSLSKSKYCGLWQCPKIAWLNKYKPEEMVINDAIQSRMDAGNMVGDLAMGLFGEFVEVTAYNGEKLDLSQMIARTKEEMEKGTPVICEASFSYNGLYCAVDILRKDGDGWAIYEVKSSTSAEKDVYTADVAYQKYVLQNCGVKLTNVYLVCLNNEYVFDGTLDLQQLFKITDITVPVAFEQRNLAANLSIGERLLNDPNEPEIDISERCMHPYECAYWKYCTRHIPKPSVFDLYRMPFKKKLDCYKHGLSQYEDLILTSGITNEKQLRQMEYSLSDKGTYLDKEGIRAFLNTLSYPLYFLDFETMQLPVPQFPGTKPYQQIPFQYSLHYIEKPGGELKHKEFLGVSGGDPRRAIAESLCRDIPMNVCVTAYNRGFECGRIKELACAFPDLAEHLLNIRFNIQDLLTPFQSGYYYNRDMGGSFSIKSVLPALYPDDPELDYHNLEGVHNGSEAMTIFPMIKDMYPEEQAIARKNLLAYCKLDTLAMVKVWEKLVHMSQE